MPGRDRRFIIPILLLLLLLLTVATGAQAAGTIYIVNGNIVDGPSANAEDDRKQIEPYDGSYNRFTDYAAGYSMLYPAHMTVDTSLSAVRTVFSDDKTRIEVYYDNFRGTISNASDYIYYGNKFVKKSPDHSILHEDWFEAGDRQAHLLQWTRRALARLPGDKNNYVSAEIVKNDYEVYTVFIKSSDPITDAYSIPGSIRIIDKQGTARNYKQFAASATRMNAETQQFYKKYFASDSPLRWGIFEPSAPHNLSYLADIEKNVNFSFPFLLHYQMFDEYFPAIGLRNAYENGRYVELTLQTVYSGEANALWAGRNRNASMVYDILDGKYDDYFEDYARYLKDFGHPVLFRLNNEMNGDWCWYSAFYTGKDAELYKAMWRYIHGIFVKNGVENVIWVWNPHDLSLPPFKWNHYLAYYPGDEYVDVVGLTGYNTGTYFPGEYWREFAEIYPPLYAEYSMLFNKPFIITEFASNSVGGNKVAWIHRMFDQIKRLDGIKVAIWWSGVDYDRQGNPGRIYLLNEDEQVIGAFRERLKEYK